MKTFFIFCFFFFSGAVMAQEKLHLMAGAGLNTSTYQGEVNPLRVGVGLNIKTDVLYQFSKRWALECSSQVKFNQLSEFFIWDTLMTLGVRYYFEENPYYTRMFIGRSPTVVFLNDAPEVTSENNASRLQYDGRTYGLGLGKLFQTEKGTVWFIESDLTYQVLSHETGIRNDGDVPVQTFSRGTDGHIEIFSLYATIGVRVF